MSEWGTVIAALETIARAQLPGLRAAEAGFERGVRPVEKLLDTEIPHVFAHNPAEQVTAIEHGQEQCEFSVELLYVPAAGTTQEALAVLLDLYRTALQGDPTLGGACERAWVRERAIREHPEQALRVGVLEIVAEATR